MSDLVFPKLPSMSPRMGRSSEYATTIHTSVSGVEHRTSWRSTPRHRFEITFPVLREDVAAPAPFAAYSQIGVLWYFWDTHRGEWDSFLFNDRNPNTGATVQRRVRFDGPPRVSRLFGGGAVGKARWEAEVAFIEVL